MSSTSSRDIPARRYDICIIHAEDEHFFAKELRALLVRANITVLPLSDSKKPWKNNGTWDYLRTKCDIRKTWRTERNGNALKNKDTDDEKPWKILDHTWKPRENEENPENPGVASDVMDCEVGVVVLSDAFMHSLWTMQRLQQLLEASRDPQYGCSVYPIFYDIQPNDLVKEDNLMKWKSHWDQVMAMVSKADKPKTQYYKLPITVADVGTWPRLLQDISSLKGSMFQKHIGFNLVSKGIMDFVINTQHRLSFINGKHGIAQEIIDLVLSLRHRLSFIKGKQRIAQSIEDYIDLLYSDREGPCVILGMVGSPGSGKTTLCRTMVDIYRSKFPGRSFMLEFPSNENIDEDKLLQQFNTLTRNHQIASRKQYAAQQLILRNHHHRPIVIIHDKRMPMYDVDRAIFAFCEYVNEAVQRYGYFLAIDNVTYWNLPYVKKLIGNISMQKGTGSKIIITSRSKAFLALLKESSILDCVSNLKIINVPSLNREEALDALLSYCGHQEFYDTDKERYKADLDCLVEQCFVNNFVHPQLLHTLGELLNNVDQKDLHDWKYHITKLLDSSLEGLNGPSDSTTHMVPLIYLTDNSEQSHIAALLYKELLRSYNKSVISHDIESTRSLQVDTMVLVIVSEDFIIRKLPNHLPLLHRKALQIYGLIPVFCNELQPHDLTNEAKLQEWGSKISQPAFDIQKWKFVLRQLQFSRKKIVFPELSLKDNIVNLEQVFAENLSRIVCSQIPPSHICEVPFVSNIVGSDRIAEEIHQKLQENARLGLYGVAGSGKTVICEGLLTFYFEHYDYFVGKSCLIELPTEENHEKLLSELKNILKMLVNASDDILGRIRDIHHAISDIKERVSGTKVFLAIDNVRDWSKGYVAQILNGMCRDSKVIVTSRNRKALECLNLGNIMCVPTLNAREAWEAFWRYFLAYKNVPDDYKTHIKESTVYQLCSFTDCCHPKLLFEISKFFSNTIIEKELLMNICELRNLIYSTSREIKNTIITALNLNDVDLKDKKWQEILSNVSILFPQPNLLKPFWTCICIWSNVDLDQTQPEAQSILQMGEDGMLILVDPEQSQTTVMEMELEPQSSTMVQKGNVGMWKIKKDGVECHTLYGISSLTKLQPNKCHWKIGKILGIQEASHELYLQYNKKIEDATCFGVLNHDVISAIESLN